MSMSNDSENPSTPDVVDNDAHNRFEVVQDGERAELTYKIDDGHLELLHTSVPEEWRDQGVAARLVQAAITKAARDGLAIVPSCDYARNWIEGHPDEVADVEIRV